MGPRRDRHEKTDPVMPVSRKRIAVLFHKRDRYYNPSRYVVHHLADCWREDGHEVIYLYGVKRFVPADIILVHVNLSVVPEAYLEFASRYPIALNNRVRDIRKSTISRNIVGPGDAWDGPVIVKSDLNYAGRPERVLSRSWLERRWRPSRRVRRVVERLVGRRIPFVETTDYEVFNSLDAVPERWFQHPQVVVEKFRPEIDGGLFCNRIYQFLGDRWTCTRLASTHPVVKMTGSVRADDIEPHDEVVAWREELNLDYGKLDYAVVDGEVMLLDVNKTTGAGQFTSEEKLRDMRRYKAQGLYAYFSRRSELES